MLEGFNKHYRLFRAASREAKARFERADWQAVREAHAARILFYDERVHEAEEYLRREFNTDALPDALWQEIKLQYVGLLTNYRQPELAETFFNTVSCRILQRTYYNNDFMFVRPDDNDASRARAATLLPGNAHSMSVTVCYCSVLDDCWVTTLEVEDDNTPGPPGSCPIPVAERFTQ